MMNSIAAIGFGFHWRKTHENPKPQGLTVSPLLSVTLESFP